MFRQNRFWFKIFICLWFIAGAREPYFKIRYHHFRSLTSIIMSYVLRGSRIGVETGLPRFIQDRRLTRMQAGIRPVNNNSMAFLLTVLVLFMILNSHQMSPNFLIWLLLVVFLMVTSLRMYATCQQLQAEAHAHAAAASGLLGHTELRLHVPPSIALATRGRLQSLRLQLALLDREFDDLDYDALRALDSDNPPDVPSMTEEEINSLPAHKYKVLSGEGSNSGWKSNGSSFQQASSSSITTSEQKRLESGKLNGNFNSQEDELTCSVCLEQVNVGEIVRSLPCLHQFHANCIDPWLRQQGTCPVCKHKVNSAWHMTGEDATDMV
ncbi:E3 ubiquitin-protein ligase SDIR1-like isoform X1 [Zingiber officinale]|uniref:E3 ubiquitin-protein ligase SDIR1-like isoform X1 n=2 Tax=Zingiber officinale TaxID=94328 RepID=UPI001C4B99E2|nr:E3 ubiquitin-protein ligase SDIR1-like isoform X1 [Zingiber officinale]XP_042434308.1 E3 ubiquitin-protein ligase SDIR1-like isoform X1 [Zingiber officinale]